MSAVEHFRAAMRSAGLDYAGEIIPDGRIHRFKTTDDHNKNSWYVLHPGPPSAGKFGCFKRCLSEPWCERNKDLSKVEWDLVRRRWQEAERERGKADFVRQAKARETAAWILNRSKPATTHTYLSTKGVKVFGGVRECRGALVLPLHDATGELHSAQFIGVDGSKRFLSGGRIAGCFCTVADGQAGPLVVAEGYATAASVHEATGFATVAAMNCGNIKAVGEELRAKWPGREIIIAADNDQRTQGNPGLTKAREAALSIGARLAVPQFANETTKPTDFNDLHQLEGLITVKAQIETATSPKETDEELFQRLAKLTPAEYDRAREGEADRAGIRVGTLDMEVVKHRPRDVVPAVVQGSTVTSPDLEPWPEPVDGVALLNDIAALLEKFVKLPPNTADVLAVWCLQCWCYELFEFAAIVAVWSPEEACGKGRVLDVTEKVVRRPFRTSNTSAAVLYHVISSGKLTVLVDEMDSIGDEQRAAVCNILKGGFQSNGTAHRMTERNGEQIVAEFPTYCPKMIATISLDKLDKATRSRTIGIRMQRKHRSQKVAKFRRVDSTAVRQKCLRWVQDNTEAIKAVPPMDLDECATDRQEDVWEPLVAIARVAGGDWEKRVRYAARLLTGSGSDGASETDGHQLLAAFRAFFTGHPGLASTKQIIEVLNKDGDFVDANRGRGLTAQYVAKLMKPYGIEPRNHRMPGGDVLRGYSLEDCQQAFSTYLCDAAPETPVPKCYTATKPENIDQNGVFENATQPVCSTSENPVSANVHAGCSGVAFPTAGNGSGCIGSGEEPATDKAYA